VDHRRFPAVPRRGRATIEGHRSPPLTGNSRTTCCRLARVEQRWGRALRDGVRNAGGGPRRAGTATWDARVGSHEFGPSAARSPPLRCPARARARRQGRPVAVGAAVAAGRVREPGAA
jgi:hypothetical protein